MYLHEIQNVKNDVKKLPVPLHSAGLLVLFSIKLIHPRLDLRNLIINHLLHARIDCTILGKHVAAVNAIWNELQRSVCGTCELTAGLVDARDGAVSPGVELAVGPDKTCQVVGNVPAPSVGVDVLDSLALGGTICAGSREEQGTLTLPVLGCDETGDDGGLVLWSAVLPVCKAGIIFSASLITITRSEEGKELTARCTGTTPIADRSRCQRSCQCKTGWRCCNCQSTQAHTRRSTHHIHSWRRL